ncbi:MAG: methyltransferase domain-containing protein [Gammaproteobacteria bacterium]|nr:MAG: methyltransferase domain-containing protein [Gammaproteobacteria bacterium]
MCTAIVGWPGMGTHKHLPPPSLEELGLQSFGMPGERLSGERLLKPKRFRFQLLSDFIATTFDTSMRVLDVGGGKGLLTYLLRQQGYAACVVEPEFQILPGKYKDLRTNRRVKIPKDETVPRISANFAVQHAKDFDLLIGLHAHGSNLKMLEAAARYGKPCVLMPCCVIGEPTTPTPGESWFKWLVMKAEEAGLGVEYFYLNFKGQNVGFIAR